jgi:lipid-A-disaccharide synthase
MAAPSSPLRIFISTGEVSGDLQGALLVQALYRQAAAQNIPLSVSALGGDRMAAAGATLVGNTTAIGSVGILEALPYVLPTLRIQQHARRYLQAEPPDLIIYIDYMGPNLALGKFIQQRFPQVPTVYYIAPQQWAWAFSRKDTEALVAMSDAMVAIFPQEADYYRKFGAQVHYFGHPLVDRFFPPPDRAAARDRFGLGHTDLVVTLVPASRQQEVVYVLPLMLAAARHIQTAEPQVKFLMPVSRASLRPALAAAIARSGLAITLVDEDTQQAIAAADVALTKSGTVNLEMALMNVPQVVTYRINPVTARIAYYLLRFRVPFVSPVNLSVGTAVVPEFIQWHAEPAALAQATLDLLHCGPAREQMLAAYRHLRQALGEPGVCDRAAQALLQQAQAGRAVV